MNSNKPQHSEPTPFEPRALSQSNDDEDHALLVVEWHIRKEVFSLVTHIVRAVGIVLYLLVCLLVEVLTLVVDFPTTCLVVAVAACCVLWLQDTNVAETLDELSESGYQN
jgi:hypothetical protein